MATSSKDLERANLPIKGLVIHCTDSGDKRDFTAKDVDAWHRERGFDGIGYHYLIRRSGEIEAGRSVGRIGAHTYGFNRHTLGLSWVGTHEPTPAQYMTLIHLAACLVKKFGLPFNQGAATIAIKGHGEYPDQHRTCPNLDMNQVRKDVLWRLKELEGVKDACDLVGAVCGRH